MSTSARTVDDRADSRAVWGLAGVAASLLFSTLSFLAFLSRRSTPPRSELTVPRLLTSGYLVEALLLGVLVLVALGWELWRGRPRLGLLWVALGALAALTILSVWSAAFALLPVFSTGLLAAFAATHRSNGSAGRAIVVALAGFALQVALMVAVVVVLRP